MDFHVLPYELAMFRMYGAGAGVAGADGTLYPETDPGLFAGAGVGAVPNVYGSASLP